MPRLTTSLEALKISVSLVVKTFSTPKTSSVRLRLATKLGMHPLEESRLWTMPKLPSERRWADAWSMKDRLAPSLPPLARSRASLRRGSWNLCWRPKYRAMPGCSSVSWQPLLDHFHMWILRTTAWETCFSQRSWSLSWRRNCKTNAPSKRSCEPSNSAAGNPQRKARPPRGCLPKCQEPSLCLTTCSLPSRLVDQRLQRTSMECKVYPGRSRFSRSTLVAQHTETSWLQAIQNSRSFTSTSQAGIASALGLRYSCERHLRIWSQQSARAWTVHASR